MRFSLTKKYILGQGRLSNLFGSETDVSGKKAFWNWFFDDEKAMHLRKNIIKTIISEPTQNCLGNSKMNIEALRSAEQCWVVPQKGQLCSRGREQNGTVNHRTTTYVFKLSPSAQLKKASTAKIEFGTAENGPSRVWWYQVTTTHHNHGTVSIPKDHEMHYCRNVPGCPTCVKIRHHELTITAHFSKICLLAKDCFYHVRVFPSIHFKDIDICLQPAPEVFHKKSR